MLGWGDFADQGLSRVYTPNSEAIHNTWRAIALRCTEPSSPGYRRLPHRYQGGVEGIHHVEEEHRRCQSLGDFQNAPRNNFIGSGFRPTFRRRGLGMVRGRGSKHLLEISWTGTKTLRMAATRAIIGLDRELRYCGRTFIEPRILSGLQKPVSHLSASFDDEVLGVNLNLRKRYDVAPIHPDQSLPEVVEEKALAPVSNQFLGEQIFDLDPYSELVGILCLLP